MKETPILFSGAMVRAILRGDKFQTRRPVKPAPSPDAFRSVHCPDLLEDRGRCIQPPCAAGDLAWVRETFTPEPNGGALYAADFTEADKEHIAWKWTPSIHMLRWASRVTLPIVEVRIERVQAITAEDARAEGVTVPRCDCEVCSRGLAICPADATSYIEGFRDLWAATYGRESWEANPWVWVLRWEKAIVKGAS